MKTKTIFLKDNRVVTIDEDAEIKVGDWHINSQGNELLILKDDGNQSHGMCACKKIIASYPKLEGVPEYESLPIEDDVDSKIEAIFNCKKDLFQQKEWNWFVRIYKAAKQEGCFTEEDIEKAFQAGMLWMGEYQNREHSDGWKKIPNQEQCLQSLKQLEWEFEVEMEYSGSPFIEINDKKQQPKIINNKIQGKWTT